MWKVKTEVIPVIIQTIGTISKSLRKYPSKISGKHDNKELHKTATLGTPNIILFFLVAQQPYSSVGFEITIRQTQSVGLLWTSDRSIT